MAGRKPSLHKLLTVTPKLREHAWAFLQCRTVVADHSNYHVAIARVSCRGTWWTMYRYNGHLIAWGNKGIDRVFLDPNIEGRGGAAVRQRLTAIAQLCTPPTDGVPYFMEERKKVYLVHWKEDTAEGSEQTRTEIPPGFCAVFRTAAVPRFAGFEGTATAMSETPECLMRDLYESE